MSGCIYEREPYGDYQVDGQRFRLITKEGRCEEGQYEKIRIVGNMRLR